MLYKCFSHHLNLQTKINRHYFFAFHPLREGIIEGQNVLFPLLYSSPGHTIVISTALSRIFGRIGNLRLLRLLGSPAAALIIKETDIIITRKYRREFLKLLPRFLQPPSSGSRLLSLAIPVFLCCFLSLCVRVHRPLC